jgi:copper chaperone
MSGQDQSGGIVTIAVEGMSCGHCVQAVERALASTPGVGVLSVSVGAAVIDVQAGAPAGTVVRAVAAIETAGFGASIAGGR